MPGGTLRLAVVLALLGTGAQGVLKPNLPAGGTAARTAGVQAVLQAGSHVKADAGGSSSAARKALEPLAPMVIMLDQCGGALKPVIDGIVMGVMLGMEILLPASNDIFEMWSMSRRVDDLYSQYWCTTTSQDAPSWLSSLWCSEDPHRPFYNLGQVAAVKTAFLELNGTDKDVKILDFKPEMMDGHDLDAWRRKLLNRTMGPHGGHKRILLNTDCSPFSLKVDSSDRDLWLLWWRVSDALDFALPIKMASDRIISAIEGLGEISRHRAETRNLPSVPLARAPVRGRAFNVLHLQVSNEWVQQCHAWMGLDDGVHRDNCMNNTQNVAEVLVTEGLDPSLPLYVDIPLTSEELLEMGNAEIQGQYGPGFRGLAEAFTVVTKGTVLRSLGIEPGARSPAQWAAVDFLVASASKEYVGNSVAVDSAHLAMVRRRNGRRAWHYNGGCTPLRESGALKPAEALSVPTIREPLKWVFTIHAGEGNLSKSFVEMVKVAVLSARKHSGLVPICVTSADPSSEISAWLVSNGVRVLHHTPAWAPAMRQKARDLQSSPVYEESKARSHLFADPDAVVGAFMRLDLPILGILDEFVLYTDVDVLFRSKVDWRSLLPDADLDSIRMTNDFARGKQNFSEPGGLPRFFAASSEIEQSADPSMMNAGVMLMNLRSLRETYESLKDFIFNDTDLQWDEGPLYQGAIKSFYADPTGSPQINFLPWSLNWKPYWPPNSRAALIHFHGPKCSRDIKPYIQEREVHTQLFGVLLEACTQDGDCESLCHEYDSYSSLLK